jgi:hypothetical protein
MLLMLGLVSGACGACGDGRDLQNAVDAGGSETSASGPDDAVAGLVDTTDAGAPDGFEAVDTSAAPSLEPIPANTEPCRNPRYWPYSLHEAVADVRVHFRRREHEGIAREVAAAATFSLQFQQEVSAFRRPASDEGRCGPDAALDIFLWERAPLTYTDLVAMNEATAWEDGYPFIVLDAIDTFGGAALPSTVAHELNHALQAADAWFDSPIAFEMTAMFVEDQVFPLDDNWLYFVEDYQQSPHLAVDHDDGYETLYMYGSVLYLQYLQARFFPGDPSFIGHIWLGMRSPEDNNEPDFLDAIERVLEPAGRGFADTVVEFARWRWYTNYRDVGLHLPEGGAHPARAMVMPREPAFIDGKTLFMLRTMMFGSEYIELAQTTASTYQVEVTSNAPIDWVVQALTNDARDTDTLVVRQADGLYRVQAEGQPLTLVFTALPGPTEDADPDTRNTSFFNATVRIDAVPAGPP